MWGRSIITYFDWEKQLCGQLAKEYIGDRSKHRQQGWQRGQKGNELTNAKGAGKYLPCLCPKICEAKSHSEHRKHKGNLVKLWKNLLGCHYRNKHRAVWQKVESGLTFDCMMPSTCKRTWLLCNVHNVFLLFTLQCSGWKIKLLPLWWFYKKV